MYMVKQKRNRAHFFVRLIVGHSSAKNEHYAPSRNHYTDVGFILNEFVIGHPVQ